MMRFLTFGFIFCQIVLQPQAEKFDSRGSRKLKNHEILETAESRYHPSHDQPDRDYSNYNNRIARKDYNLPITFKAPHYEAQDFWRDKHDHYNRRTFFESFSHGSHDKNTTPFPGLYQFMSSIFGGRDETPSEYSEAYYNHGRPTPPYTYIPPPYSYGPTEPNYIPPPKPIRASVIKLETVTRSPPIYHSFEYETTTKYYPHVGTILNHVLIENSKAQQHFHPQEPLEKIPPFKPLPVLPRPGYVPPTTLKPYLGFLNHRTSNHRNDSDYKYPESVQDQLPPIHPGEVKIPYESEKPIPQIFPTDTSPEREFAYTEEFLPPSDSRATTDILELIDIRSLNSPVGRGGRPNGIKLDFDTTTIKSFPGAVEKVKRPTFKKKLTAQLDNNPVERVTNLTVLGYSKVGNGNAHNAVNYLNVKELIDYEMAKLKNTSHNSSAPTVNLNDELSLDAKILKDTNWDGLAIPTTPATIKVIKETTTFPSVVRIEPKKPNKTAFWEIQTTLTPTASDVTETITVTEQPRTTTFWPPTETSEFTTTEEAGTRRIPAERRFENLERKTFKPAMEDPEVTVPPERTTFKRRYSRRPKVVSFTPYPSPEEVQKKLVNRNYFPKRQKPNITLAFGNKNVLKNTQSVGGKDEVMKFSDEDVRKSRKSGKRRRVYKRIRTSSSERPVEDDSL